MEVDRDRKSGMVCLTKKGYLKEVLHKFNIYGNTKSVSTLLAPYFMLKATMSPTTFEECEYISHVFYTSVVGSLMYVMVCTKLIYHKLSQ